MRRHSEVPHATRFQHRSHRPALQEQVVARPAVMLKHDAAGDSSPECIRPHHVRCKKPSATIRSVQNPAPAALPQPGCDAASPYLLQSHACSEFNMQSAAGKGVLARTDTFVNREPSHAYSPNAKSPLRRAGFSLILCRRSPNLPHTFACSTIGPVRLNFRVRDGNGWDPHGMVTGKLRRLAGVRARYRNPEGYARRTCGPPLIFGAAPGRRVIPQPVSALNMFFQSNVQQTGATLNLISHNEIDWYCVSLLHGLLNLFRAAFLLRRVNSMDKPNGRLVLVS